MGEGASVWLWPADIQCLDVDHGVLLGLLRRLHDQLVLYALVSTIEGGHAQTAAKAFLIERLG